MNKTFCHPIVCTLAAIMLLLIAACANQGSGPDGGPYDETPPKIVAMTPEMGKLGTKSKKIEIVFDENIKVNNPQENIIVSPPQIELPEIAFTGKRIKIELLDSLKPETTYTIDFSDAITDNNEDNPLGNFTYFFSTGQTVDTMEISGYVLQAEDLAPMKGVLVGVYADETDSSFTSKPLDRVGRTDANGHFSIKGLKHGRYRIYALKDMDGDYFFGARGEIIGWTDSLFTTSAYADVRYDTIWRDTVFYDSIRTINFTHYLPDNVVLTAFQQTNKPRHFLKQQRDVPEWFRLYFSGPSDSIPQIRGLNFNADEAFIVERTPHNDTLTYWLRDTAMYRLDTLHIVCSYMETDDSLGIDTLKSDTLRLTARQTMAKRDKQRAEEIKEWNKKQEKLRKKGKDVEAAPPPKLMKIEAKVSSTISPMENVSITLPEPLQRLDTAGIHLCLGHDSLQTEAYFELRPHPYKLTQYTLLGEWRYGQEYTLTIDSACMQGLSTTWNEPITRKFKVGLESEYGALFITLPDADTSAVVQVMQNDKKILAEQHIKNGRADFYYFKAGMVYLRLFYDHNGNGVWDPGNFAEKRQAEEVYYYNQPVQLRTNWDTEVVWRVHEVPIDKQRPAELQKNKERQRTSTAHQRNLERMRRK